MYFFYFVAHKLKRGHYWSPLIIINQRDDWKYNNNVDIFIMWLLNPLYSTWVYYCRQLHYKLEQITIENPLHAAPHHQFPTSRKFFSSFCKVFFSLCGWFLQEEGSMHFPHFRQNKQFDQRIGGNFIASFKVLYDQSAMKI